MAADNIEIEFLPDGSLKISTDKVSAPNHSNAEKFLLDLARGMGGKTTRTRKAGAVHSHTHKHSHKHSA